MNITEYKKGGKEKFAQYILGADVGGTNSNFGIFGIKKKPILLFSIHFSSREINSIIPAIISVMSYCRERGITIKKACIGAAGVISEDRKKCKITNLAWEIDTEEIKKKTKLTSCFLINDFEAIAL